MPFDPDIVDLGWGFVNVWGVRGEGGVVLVDAHYPGHEDRVLRRLDRHGIAPSDVKLVVLTHGHSDHAGSAAALALRLNVPVWVGAGDEAMVTAGEHGVHPPATGSRGRLLSFVAKPHFPPVTGAVPIAEPRSLAAFGVDATVSPVGGHTPGSLVVETADHALLVGDLIRSGMFAHRDPELHFFHDDPLAAHAALARVVTDTVTAVYPGHGGPIPTARLLRWLERRRPKVDERWTR